MDFAQARRKLVASMEASGVLSSPRVRAAFLAVPREAFLPEALRAHAYVDDALPIGFGQTISQPSTIAAMLERLEVREGQRVLEVGCGSGYVLALLKHLAGKAGVVVGVERVGELAARARTTLASLDVDAQVVHADGRMGLAGEDPFDRILVSAACPAVPHLLQTQLAPRGRLVAPVGDENVQKLVLLERVDGRTRERFSRQLYAFVPLKPGLA